MERVDSPISLSPLSKIRQIYVGQLQISVVAYSGEQRKRRQTKKTKPLHARHHQPEKKAN